MKQVYYIMKAELQSLFYSPIAWLILVILTVQCSLSFCNTLDAMTQLIAEGKEISGLTEQFFGRNWMGQDVFSAAMRYFYIYFPLLTMGLISRELASGSIKLLDSSPLGTFQIVLGKYLSMVVYSLVLIAILAIFVMSGFILIPGFNSTLILVEILGMFLTMLTYSAIGLFVSSLTRYPVVAAIGSFVVFFVLERIGGYGQNWDGVREITSWFSLSGRTDAFLKGLLTSQNVVYFLGMILMFFSFTVLKLWLAHFHYSVWRQAAYYVGIVAVVATVGWVTSLPNLRLYSDVTEDGKNTIKAESQEVMHALRDNGTLTITTYVNLVDRFAELGLPASITGDKAGFDKYTRFKPDIDFKYVYYYAPTDMPHTLQRMHPELTFEEAAKRIARLHRVDFDMFLGKEELDQVENLASERYRFVRFLELEDGRCGVLRVFDDVYPLPNELEEMVAFKRLLGGMPAVGIVTGHGERSVRNGDSRGYGQMISNVFNRYSWLNQGLDVEDVTLEEKIPAHLNFILIADPQENFTEEELSRLDEYVERGGNLALFVEPGSHTVTRPLLSRFGIELLPGVLVEKSDEELSDVVNTRFTPRGKQVLNCREYPYGEPTLVVNKVAGFRVEEQTDFTVTPLLATTDKAWNKMGKINWKSNDLGADASLGEQVGTKTTALALTRMVGEKEQRVYISGDADWMGGTGVKGRPRAFPMHNSDEMSSLLCSWMTYDHVPLKLSAPAPTDASLSLSQGGAVWFRWISVWGLPSLLAIGGLFLCVRRNRV